MGSASGFEKSLLVMRRWGRFLLFGVEEGGKRDSGCIEQMKEMEGLVGLEAIPCSMLGCVVPFAEGLSIK
jgi:hypothetical protein